MTAAPAPPEAPVPDAAASGALLANLVRFTRLLAAAGLDGGLPNTVDLARALGEIDLGRKRDVYFTLRALAVRHRDEIPIFDAAFEMFWRAPRGPASALDLAAMGERRRVRHRRFDPPAGVRGAAAGAGVRDSTAEPRLVPSLRGASRDELLQRKEFGEMTGEELDEVARFVESFRWRMGDRRTRREIAGEGRGLDLPRTVRASLERGGEILEWRHRLRRRKPRPLVVLADVSGSMERTTRVLLLFLHALTRALPQRVETFVFATRLTRLTRALSGRALEQALAEASRLVPDWSGGTRIGEALERFRFDWWRRVLSTSAVVLLVTDGWERGEPALLAKEMAHLARGCYRLIWLNPLLGDPDYAPLARGVRAVLPHVDDFLPLHNLVTLSALARRLETLAERRPARRSVRPGSDLHARRSTGFGRQN